MGSTEYIYIYIYINAGPIFMIQIVYILLFLNTHEISPKQLLVINVIMFLLLFYSKPISSYYIPSANIGDLISISGKSAIIKKLLKIRSGETEARNGLRDTNKQK